MFFFLQWKSWLIIYKNLYECFILIVPVFFDEYCRSWIDWHVSLVLLYFDLSNLIECHFFTLKIKYTVVRAWNFKIYSWKNKKTTQTTQNRARPPNKLKRFESIFIARYFHCSCTLCYYYENEFRRVRFLSYYDYIVSVVLIIFKKL